MRSRRKAGETEGYDIAQVRQQERCQVDQRLRRKLGGEAPSMKTVVRLGYAGYPDPEALQSYPAA